MVYERKAGNLCGESEYGSDDGNVLQVILGFRGSKGP